MPKLNILTLAEQIPDEAAAYEYLEGLRWDGTPVCPHCGSDDRCYFLTPKNGKTYVGGSEKNKHANKRTPGRGAHSKTPVLSLVNKETGEVRSQVMQYVTGPDLRKVIETHVETSVSVLHTDGLTHHHVSVAHPSSRSRNQRPDRVLMRRIDL